MKTALLALALLLPCGLCHAQGTNEKKEDGLCAEDWCRNMEFPYIGCDSDGKLVTRCTKNPNTTAGFRVPKVRLPIHFNYEAWSLAPDVTGDDGQISFYDNSNPLHPREYPLFAGHSMGMVIAAAVQRWSSTSLCPSQGPDAEYQDCELTIRWSRGRDDFRDAPSDAIIYAHALTMKRTMGSDCKIMCDPSLSYLIFNQEPELLQRDEYGRPRNLIATERENYSSLSFTDYRLSPYVYLDAYTTVLHELGHWLGFGHTDQAGCGDPDGIMKSAWDGLEMGDLSPEDACMFLKLYCCKETQTVVQTPTVPCPNCPPDNHTKPGIDGSAEAGSDISFTVAPNPVTAGTVTLSLYGTFATGTASLHVVDASGDIVLTQQIHDAASTHEVSVDVSTLPTGAYMLQLVDGDKTFGQKIILSE